MKKILIIIVFVMYSILSISQKPCNFCDTLKPYKHHLSIQANRTFDNFRDFSTYLLELATGTGDRDRSSYIIDLRYGYRVHKNIEIGAELINNGHKSKFVTDNNKEKNYSINKFKAGIYSRFIMNRWQVFKPYADIGLGYFRMKSNLGDEPSTIMNKFDCYSVLGISFMIWKNHINIDLGAKYSPIKWSNVNGKKVLFTWKIGYNFNAK